MFTENEENEEQAELNSPQIIEEEDETSPRQDYRHDASEREAINVSETPKKQRFVERRAVELVEPAHNALIHSRTEEIIQKENEVIYLRDEVDFLRQKVRICEERSDELQSALEEQKCDLISR